MIHLKTIDKTKPRRFAALIEPTELDGKPIRSEDMLHAAVARAGSVTIRLLAIDWTPLELVTMPAAEFLNEWMGD